jgi:hypothetical protein
MKKYTLCFLIALTLGIIWLRPGQAGPLPPTAPSRVYQYKMIVASLPRVVSGRSEVGPALDFGDWEVFDVRAADANVDNPAQDQPTTGCIVYSLRKPMP